MEFDEPGRRPGGPRRAPVNRPAPRQPAPRRTSGRTGAAPRRPRPAGGAGRGGRPGPAPRQVPSADPGFTDRGYGDRGYGDPRYADPGYVEPRYGNPGYADDHAYQDAPYPEQPPAPPGARRGGKGKAGKGKGAARNAKGPKGAKARKGAKAGKGRRPASAPVAGFHAPRDSDGAGPGGRSPRGGPPVPRNLAALGPKAYFAAAGALAAVVLLGFGALAMTGGADGTDARGAALPPVGTAAETGPSPTSYSNSPSSEAYAGIGAREADAEPLTIEEAFPKGAQTLQVPETDLELELAAKKLDGDCAAAVWGASVAADLRRGGCSQAVRGLYADADGGYGMAVAVFNLASAADADRFVATLGEVRGGGFVRPLPAEAARAEFGTGFSMARGLAQGHFAVVSWSARLDGTGDASDEALLSMLIEGGKAPAVLARAARAAE
ncbi:hypothetical protein [Actinomadura sp. WMMB 499]|uniref:hypothetical protein n=1 Tax=Actinomadura sp. WMMB 499 TaxID=1219491 RepID=UPI0012457F3F|nr:hypothetical protein [Actinomadura sp. WMMB 499]QFG25972.1 hypothetical protein F7P10_37320 [Actinomadura sp. WMMB 499]